MLPFRTTLILVVFAIPSAVAKASLLAPIPEGFSVPTTAVPFAAAKGWQPGWISRLCATSAPPSNQREDLDRGTGNRLMHIFLLDEARSINHFPEKVKKLFERFDNAEKLMQAFLDHSESKIAQQCKNKFGADYEAHKAKKIQELLYQLNGMARQNKGDPGGAAAWDTFFMHNLVAARQAIEENQSVLRYYGALYGGLDLAKAEAKFETARTTLHALSANNWGKMIEELKLGGDAKKDCRNLSGSKLNVRFFPGECVASSIPVVRCNPSQNRSGGV